MLQHNLIDLLKTCSNNELKSFKKFIQSPYHNNSESIVILYNELVKYAPKFESKKLSRATIFNAVFSDQPLKDEKLLTLMRKLESLLGEFFVAEKHKNDKIEANRLIAHRFKDNKDIWQKYIEQNKKLLNKSTTYDAHYYYLHFQHELDKHQLIEYEGNRNIEPNLQNLIESLNFFYLVNGLKYHYKTINFQSFKKYDYDISFLNLVTDYIKNNEFEDEVLIVKIYQLGLKIAIDKDSDDSFLDLKALLIKEYKKFPKGEIREMFSNLNNYCIKKINKGESDFVVHLLDVYKFQVEHEIIVFKGKIKPALFKNIATISILAEDLEWLEQFLLRNKEKVNETVFDICLAQYKFELAEYNEALDLVETSKYKDTLFKLNAYSISIQALYELANDSLDVAEYDGLLDNKIKSFDRWLRRESKKNSLPKHAFFYDNFLRLIKSIYKSLHDPNISKSQIQVIEKEIKASKTQAKRWLIAKVKSL